MKIHLARPTHISAHLTLFLTLLLGACSGTGTASIIPSGGSNSGNGGSTDVAGTDVGGAGGRSSTGVGGASAGSQNTGGAMTGNGGSPTTGGAKTAGGTPATGGVNATGGIVSTGGTKAATGGMVSTGGTKAATGGMPSTGGTKAATGGMAPTGGAKATGGMPTGGMAPTGGAKATGGAVATSCSFPSGWNPGSPTYTTYTLPNAQTACGYNGSNNRITNIVNGANFAAIPGNSSSDFNTSNRCGACVQIGSAIITIVDECPFPGNTPCQNNPTGHLDLSQAAASAAGVQGDPSLRNQAAWKFIPCPVTGNVIVRLKNGNNNEFYIENEILPIQSVTCGGQTGSRQSYGAWHFGANVNGQSCSATDIGNRSITFTVGNSQGQDVDTGQQFPKCN